MRSVVDRNVVMRRITVQNRKYISFHAMTEVRTQAASVRHQLFSFFRKPNYLCRNVSNDALNEVGDCKK